MQTFLINALMYIVGRLVDGGLLESIKAIVLIYTSDSTLTGAQKKDAVDAELRALKGREADIFIKTSGNLVNLAIEAAVIWAKSKVGVTTSTAA